MSLDDNLPAEPFAVPLPEAKRLLGGKCIAGIYVALGLGQLQAVKDGARTLVTTASIKAYQASWPRARIKPPKPRARK
jgi:hypothetical protein